MSSSDRSGWTIDYLNSIDSIVYTAGLVTSQTSWSYNSGKISSGYRTLNSTYANNRVVVSTQQTWDTVLDQWINDYKDSMVFAQPIAFTNTQELDISTVSEIHWSTYNEEISNWVPSQSIKKISSESLGLKVTFEATELDVDSSSNYKITMYFKSPQMINSNLLAVAEKEKSPISNSYEYTDSMSYSFNGSGFQVAIDGYEWDASVGAWKPSYRNGSYPDSYGNDTLVYSCDWNTLKSAWDTSYVDKWSYQYDSHGNMLSKINYYMNTRNEWVPSTKIEYTYAQINIPMARKTHFVKSQDNIKIDFSQKLLRVKAPGCTKLAVYDLSGKQVAMVKQAASSSISVDLGSKSLNAKYTYIVKLSSALGDKVFRILPQ